MTASTTPTAPRIDESWRVALSDEFDSDYMRDLSAFLRRRKREGATIFPPGDQIFRAFDTTPFDDVKVVIMGQDPYHGAGQACGMSFSVPRGTRVPPSLRNIYREIEDELSITMPEHGDLTAWSDQGVLMLNATLTVEQGRAGSHQGQGWETFTDAAIRALSARRAGIVFLLWGKFAQGKADLIDQTRHHVLVSAHPSPYSANNGFFGNRHFVRTNELLAEQGEDPIDWQLPA